MRIFGLVLLAAGGMFGCGDPAGVVRVHFELHPPAVIDFGRLAPAPIDRLAAARADGALDASPPAGELIVELSGLPLAPTDPHMSYRLWASASVSGGDWAHVADVGPSASGAATIHAEQANVPIDFDTIRSAVLTLDGHGVVGPSSAVILSGSTESDAVVAVPGADAGAGGHNH